MCTDLTWEGTAPRRPAQRTAEAPLRCGHCAWSRLPLLAFLSSLQGRDETRHHPFSLSPSPSLDPTSLAVSAALCPCPLPCRDLHTPPPNRRNFLSPPPPHLGSSPTPRAQPAPLTQVRNPPNPQSVPTGARRFRRIRAPPVRRSA